MGDEVCQFGKFGFCKFKESCKRKHYSEVCESLSMCTNIKECPKRHPKMCRRLNSENKCRFKEECAYNHKRIKPNEDVNVLKDKVDILENTVKELTKKVEVQNLEQMERVMHALTRKVLSLENEIEAMKNKVKTDKKVENEKYLEKESSFNISDIKHSTPKVLKEKEKTDGSKEGMINCKECSYKCKKELSLKKHMVTKHESHKCKECKEELSTFMELLKHVAQHHNKDKEKEDINDSTEKDIEKKHTKNENKVKKDNVFVFKGNPDMVKM